MAARIFGDGVKCTVGNDADVAAAINSMGALHIRAVWSMSLHSTRR